MRKWRFNICRPMEQVAKDELPKSKKGRRYAHKNFVEFKKPVSLKKGYEMYTEKPSDKKKKAKRNKKKAKAEPSGRKTRLIDQDEDKKKRNPSQMTQTIRALKKRHPIITINAGNLKSNIEEVT